MDKVTYLKLKAEREEKLKQSFKRESFCYQCYKLKAQCLCAQIKPFDSFFEFVILIHPMEAKKEKMGTGRITKSFLQNSKLISGVDFTNNNEVNELISTRQCYVMYPGDNSYNVSKEDLTPFFEMKKNGQIPVIFLIDGTWPCAKKMMKLSTNLHHLPRVSFDVDRESIFKIKEQPSKFCLSTLESIHLFLDIVDQKNLLNLNQAHHQMLNVFQSMIDFQIQCASDPNLDSYRRKTKTGYKSNEERKPSKKWETRSIIYKGN